MEVDKIKRGSDLIKRIEILEIKLSELNKVDNIDNIVLSRNQSGARQYSYNVTFSEDVDFMLSIKSVITDKYERLINNLKKEIKEL